MEVLIVGGGIGGLTLGLMLHRAGDKPFRHIDDVISREELMALSDSYKRVAGTDKERLKVAT